MIFLIDTNHLSYKYDYVYNLHYINGEIFFRVGYKNDIETIQCLDRYECIKYGLRDIDSYTTHSFEEYITPLFRDINLSILID